MAQRTSVYSNNDFEQAVDPAVYTATETSAAIDLQGFNEVALLANVGASGDTLSGSLYWEFAVQESDDDVSYTAVVDADLENSVTGTTTGTFAVLNDPAEAGQRYITAYKGSKRYIKVVATGTGTIVSGLAFSVSAVKGRPAYAPVQ